MVAANAKFVHGSRVSLSYFPKNLALKRISLELFRAFCPEAAAGNTVATHHRCVVGLSWNQGGVIGRAWGIGGVGHVTDEGPLSGLSHIL